MRTYDLLRQKKYWVTADGVWLRRKRLTSSHRDNLIAFLERNAGRILRNERAHLNWLMLGAPDDVFGMLEEESDQLTRHMKSPGDWLHNQPLYRALLKDRRKEVRRNDDHRDSHLG